ncbi:MAG TPA: peptidylprolyl isomerase [Acidimicrobiales bacterium]
MTSRISRTFVVGCAVLGALLFATGCDNPIDPDAATVDGVRISRDELFEQAELLKVFPDARLAVDTENAFSGEGIATVLSGLVIDRIYEASAERFGLTVTEDDIAAAREQFGADLERLPDDAAEDLLRRYALRQAVDRYVTTEKWWTEEDVARYHAKTSEQACVRHILVDSEDAANEILAELRGGADFAELARERSTDTASALDGGALGCRPRDYFIDPFEDAIEDADDGELVGPVESNIGGQQRWHVILVDQAYHQRTLDEARADIEALFEQGGWPEYVLRTTDVDVDPRFGTWDPTIPAVAPPPGAQSPS